MFDKIGIGFQTKKCLHQSVTDFHSTDIPIKSLVNMLAVVAKEHLGQQAFF